MFSTARPLPVAPGFRGRCRATLSFKPVNWAAMRTLELTGSQLPQRGGVASAVDFEDLYLDNINCGRTWGGLHIRDQHGGWHEAQFGTENNVTAHCDRCGNLSFDGEVLGELCADETAMTDILAWGTTPW